MFFKKKVILPLHIKECRDAINSSAISLDKPILGSSLELSNDCAKHSLVVFVGGAMDDTYRPLLNGVFVPYSIQHSYHQDISYTTHAADHFTIRLITHWQKEGYRICLVGHSWGGNSVLRVARRLKHQRISLLVTLDSVSRRYFIRNYKKPQSVDKWINVHIDYARASREYSNTVARLGGVWGHCLHADTNIKLSKDQQTEITHAMAARLFEEVIDEVEKI